MSVTRFESVVSASTLGTADVDKLTAAIDKQSAALDQLGKKSEQIKTPKWESFASSVKTFIQDPLTASGTAVEGFLLKLGPMGAAVTTAAAGLGILAKTGLEWERQLGELGDRLGDISIRTGLTIKETGEFSFAMKRAGGDISQVEGLMRKLSQGLADNSDEGKKVREGFSQLGITTHDLHGNTLSMSSILLQLSQNLNKVEDTANRNAIAMKIMGRSALDALPDLLELSAGVKRSRELGLAPSEEDAKRWDGYQKQIAEVDAQWDQLARKMKEPLVAAISFVIGTPGGKKFDSAELARAGRGVESPKDQFSEQVRQSIESELKRLGLLYAPGASAASGIMTGVNQNIAGVRRNDAAVAAALLGTTEDQLSKAQQKLKELQGTLKVGVLPEANAETMKQIDAQKGIIAGLEARIKATKELEEAHRKMANEFLAGEKKVIDAINEGARKYNERQDEAQSKILEGAVKNSQAFRSQQDWTWGAFEQQNTNFFLRGVSTLPTRNSDQNQERQGRELTQWMGAIQQANQVTAQLMHSQVDATARILELRAGPGGEFAAAEQVAALRKQALEDEFRLTGDIEKMRAEGQQIELDRAIRIEELRRQGIERARSTGEASFDALIAGGAGIKSFGLSQLTGIGRTVAGNLSAELYKPGRFSLTDNPNSFLGKLLAGTPLGADPLKSATDQNTLATIANTAALKSISIGGVGGIGGFSSASGTFARYAQEFGLPGGGAAPDIYNLPTTSRTLDPFFLSGGNIFKAPPTGGFNWAKGAGIAGSAAAGAFGVYQGIQAGGAEGVLTASGSAVSAAASILTLALPKVIGAAGPIGMLAGLGLGLAASFLPNSKEHRQKEIDRQIEAARYTAPEATTYLMDRRGRGFDYDTQGNVRPIEVHVHVDAIDQKGFVDHANDIAEAVSVAFEGKMSPRLEAATRSVAFRN